MGQDITTQRYIIQPIIRSWPKLVSAQYNTKVALDHSVTDTLHKRSQQIEHASTL